MCSNLESCNCSGVCLDLSICLTFLVSIMLVATIITHDMKQVDIVKNTFAHKLFVHGVQIMMTMVCEH